MNNRARLHSSNGGNVITDGHALPPREGDGLGAFAGLWLALPISALCYLAAYLIYRLF